MNDGAQLIMKAFLPAWETPLIPTAVGTADKTRRIANPREQWTCFYGILDDEDFELAEQNTLEYTPRLGDM